MCVDSILLGDFPEYTDISLVEGVRQILKNLPDTRRSIVT
jgi:hypothetical protein